MLKVQKWFDDFEVIRGTGDNQTQEFTGTKHQCESYVKLATPHKEKMSRLLVLAEFLKTIPEHKFNLRTWTTADSLESCNDHTCGTTACAFGWACNIKEFKEAGLRSQRGCPTFNGFMAYSAGQDFFALTYTEAIRLFSPDAYTRDGIRFNPSNVFVANRIKRLAEAKIRKLNKGAK